MLLRKTVSRSESILAGQTGDTANGCGDAAQEQLANSDRNLKTKNDTREYQQSLVILLDSTMELIDRGGVEVKL